MSSDLQNRFREVAESLGFDPNSPWIGDYVAYEWNHFRYLLPADVKGWRVLEFGCNVGASAIVLSKLGALVTGVEPNDRYLKLAVANAEQHEAKVEFHEISDTTALPFPSKSFELITCNSVLEYVPNEQLPGVLFELDRVLSPGGQILITGTSNRLWPREVHSGRWFVNYVPQRFTKVKQGIWPWTILKHFAGYQDISATKRGRDLAQYKRLTGADDQARVIEVIGRWLPLGVSIGLIFPSIYLNLQKPK